LYAAGVILYEAITGEVPFNADTFNELLFKIVLEAAKPVEHVVPNMDPNFAAIVNKSMAREPSQRFQTAREFQQALEQWAAGAGPQFAAALNASVQTHGSPPAQHQQVPTGQYGAVATGQHPAVATGQYAAVGAGPQAAPAHTLGTGTPGSWANTGGYAPVDALPKKSNAGLFIGLGVVAVLLLGGGTFVAMSLSHGKEEAAAAAGKLEAEKAEAEKAKAQQAAAAAEAEKAAQEAVAKAGAEAEKAKAENQTLKSEAEKAKAAAAEAAKGAKVAAVAPAPRAVAKPATAKPEVKAEPKPAAAPATAAPASTGRRIRTTL
jgi:serine/threonine-protein kinase